MAGLSPETQRGLHMLSSEQFPRQSAGGSIGEAHIGTAVYDGPCMFSESRATEHPEPWLPSRGAVLPGRGVSTIHCHCPQCPRQSHNRISACQQRDPLAWPDMLLFSQGVGSQESPPIPVHGLSAILLCRPPGSWPCSLSSCVTPHPPQLF